MVVLLETVEVKRNGKCGVVVREVPKRLNLSDLYGDLSEELG